MTCENFFEERDVRRNLLEEFDSVANMFTNEELARGQNIIDELNNQLSNLNMGGR